MRQGGPTVKPRTREMKLRIAATYAASSKKEKEHHAAQALIGRCINEHSRPHELPTTNPRTKRPYTKCPACRETHKGRGNAGTRAGKYER